MYRTLDEFLQDWTIESRFTLSILRACTNDTFSHAPSPTIRSPRFLAWHIAQAIPEMMGRTGLDLTMAPEGTEPPATVEEICALYEANASALATQITERWTDAHLDMMHDMYGEQWSTAVTLQVLIRHEIHHRAQLTVILRLLGLRVPGTYGPSAEEWERYQMPPQP